MMHGGGRCACCGRFRRAVVIAAVAAAAAAAVATIMAAVHGTPRAFAGRLPASAHTEVTPKASADPATEAWVAALHEAAAAATPPLPSSDLFRSHAGLWTLHEGHGLAVGKALLEMDEARLDEPFTLTGEVSALDAGNKQFFPRLDAAALLLDRVYSFRLGGSKTVPMIELYRPPLNERSVDPESPAGRQALSGLSASTLLAFPARRTDSGRLLFDAGPWLDSGFGLSDYAGYTTQFTGGAAHPEQVTFVLDLTKEDGPGGRVKVSAVSLPRRLMKPIALDDRIGYFSRPHTWVDDYTGKKARTWGANIYKWDLVKHPVLTYYVDPTVPRSLWPAVVDGILQWNPAFAAAGHRRPVLRAVVPSDADWPADYAADDARYNTVSFVSQDEKAAMASGKLDPRTGEILNADIVFSDAMLRSMVSGYRTWFGSGREDGQGAAAGEREVGSEADYLYQHVASTTAHEVGHTLGLRHNFRGSEGIPWSQLTNESFVAAHGLTNSVMDYLPDDPVPSSKEGSPPRFFASPVIGAYDVAAIRYGYTNWTSMDDARAYAESVADAGLAFGTDEDKETDVFSQDYDISASPLEWNRYNVRQVLRRMTQLVATAGKRPAVSAADVGDDVVTVTTSGFYSVLAATKLVGATRTHRRRTATDAPAVTPLDGTTEAAAAKWTLDQLNPDDGLLSAATASMVMPHLLTKPTTGCFGDNACLGRVPWTAAETLHSWREQVLASLLSPSRLRQLVANAALTAAAGKDASHRLSVDGLLVAISETFFGSRWAHLARPDSPVSAGRLFRVEAQARWVAMLKELAGQGHAATVELAASTELSRIAEAVAEAAGDHSDDSHLRGLRLATAAFVVA